MASDRNDGTSPSLAPNAESLTCLLRSLTRMRKLPVVLIAVAASVANADSPLPPPKRIVRCSSHHTYCAVSDPITNTTVIGRAGSHKVLWSIPGWHRWLYVSNDGRSAVLGYGGINLVPKDVTLQEPVLFFYNAGRLARSVTLGDLYKSKSQLHETVSHFVWVNEVTVNSSDQLTLELIDGTKRVFAIDSGTPVDAAKH